MEHYVPEKGRLSTTQSHCKNSVNKYYYYNSKDEKKWVTHPKTDLKGISKFTTLHQINQDIKGFTVWDKDHPREYYA